MCMTFCGSVPVIQCQVPDKEILLVLLEGDKVEEQADGAEDT